MAARVRVLISGREIRVLRFSIVGLLIAWPLLIGVARAHSCCY